MINLDWITSPLAIYACLAAGGCASLYLVASTRIEMRGQQKRHLAVSQSLREDLAALQDKVREISVELEQTTLLPTAFTPFAGFHPLKRAEALRMYRRGSDCHAVSAALGLPPADVALLQKVQHILSGTAAD